MRPNLAPQIRSRMISLTLSITFWLGVSAASLSTTFDGSTESLSDLHTTGSLSGYLNSSLLLTRQTSQCSRGPGGPVCSPTTCCGAGENCATVKGIPGCCPVSASTCGGQTCCAPSTVCCPPTPTGCCVPGSVCCGSTCCPPGSICERGECIDDSVVKAKRVIRLEYDKKKNGCVLVNMCNGMRGKNTIELTYEHLDENAKNAKRRAAGCKDGYCANLKVGKNNTPSAKLGLNSCDEFPPASSLEGGDATDEFYRAINCIPGKQNSWQGGKFSRLRRWTNIQTGDKWVISIDCDKVLGPNTSPCDQYPYETLDRRDVIEISNVTTEDDYFEGSLTPEAPDNLFVLPFGDLGPGQYNATFNVVAGSVLSSYVVDNLGDDIAIPDETGISTGQSKFMSFSINATGGLMGVGMVLVVPDNTTKVEWTFKGGDIPKTSSTASGSTQPTVVPSSNSDIRLVATMWGNALASTLVILLTVFMFWLM